MLQYKLYAYAGKCNSNLNQMQQVYFCTGWYKMIVPSVSFLHPSIPPVRGVSLWPCSEYRGWTRKTQEHLELTAIIRPEPKIHKANKVSIVFLFLFFLKTINNDLTQNGQFQNCQSWSFITVHQVNFNPMD